MGTLDFFVLMGINIKNRVFQIFGFSKNCVSKMKTLRDFTVFPINSTIKIKYMVGCCTQFPFFWCLYHDIEHPYGKLESFVNLIEKIIYLWIDFSAYGPHFSRFSIFPGQEKLLTRKNFTQFSEVY